jgi:2-hydroxy-3-oxopropionate reductase
MAKNLLKAGHELVVMDRHQTHLAEFKALGAASASTPAAVAADCELVVTMLPNSPDVRAVLTGRDSVAAGARPGLTVVDASSIDPMVSRELAVELAAQGVTLLDAPVSGGEPMAVAGTLSFMVGGPREAFDRVEPVLKAMGSSVVRVGEIGAGNIAKLANQAIVAVNIAVVAEALILAQKAGVDPAGVVKAIEGGLAGSNALRAKAPMMLGHDFKPGFRVALHLKDLGNVVAASREVAAPMPLTVQAMEMMTALRAHGHEGEDHSSLLCWYEAAANVRLGGSPDGSPDGTPGGTRDSAEGVPRDGVPERTPHGAGSEG